MLTLIQSTPIIAFAVLIGFMFLGDVISFKTKAVVPAVLIFVLLLMLGAWNDIIPENIIDIPGFTSQYASYVILMFLVDMGSSISIKQFVEQWKTVVISIAAICGIALIVLTLGTALYGWDYAVVAAPPISGGLVATMEMSNSAMAIGKESLASLAVLIFTLQNFPAYIILPFFLKKYGRKLLEGYQRGDEHIQSMDTDAENKKKSFVDLIPAGCKTSAYYLFCLAILAVLANFTAGLLGGRISPTVFGLLYGLFAANFGIIEKDCMKKSGSSGFLMFSSLITIFASLAKSDPGEIAAMLLPLVVLIALGIVGIFLGSVVVGKLLKCKLELSFAIGLNCLLGFPLNYILTVESIKGITKDKDEVEYLTQNILPTMLVAGFVCVTLGSTVFASIMKNFL